MYKKQRFTCLAASYVLQHTHFADYQASLVSGSVVHKLGNHFLAPIAGRIFNHGCKAITLDRQKVYCLLFRATEKYPHQALSSYHHIFILKYVPVSSLKEACFPCDLYYDFARDLTATFLYINFNKKSLVCRFVAFYLNASWIFSDFASELLIILDSKKSSHLQI